MGKTRAIKPNPPGKRVVERRSTIVEEEEEEEERSRLPNRLRIAGVHVKRRLEPHALKEGNYIEKFSSKLRR